MNMPPFQWLLEIIVGRLVLDLPIEDLKTINKMIVRNQNNAEVQEETNPPNEL